MQFAPAFTSAQVGPYRKQPLPITRRTLGAFQFHRLDRLYRRQGVVYNRNRPTLYLHPAATPTISALFSREMMKTITLWHHTHIRTPTHFPAWRLAKDAEWINGPRMRTLWCLSHTRAHTHKHTHTITHSHTHNHAHTPLSLSLFLSLSLSHSLSLSFYLSFSLSISLSHTQRDSLSLSLFLSLALFFTCIHTQTKARTLIWLNSEFFQRSKHPCHSVLLSDHRHCHWPWCLLIFNSTWPRHWYWECS